MDLPGKASPQRIRQRAARVRNICLYMPDYFTPRTIAQQLVVVLAALICQVQAVSQSINQPAAPASPSGPNSSDALAPGLYPEHVYNGVHRPVMVNVVSPRAFGTVTLILCDASGKTMLGPVDVHPGRVDLVEIFDKKPGAGSFWKLQRVGWLQMLDREEPVGSALVIQPMLSRLVPQTQMASRSNGMRYPRIVGWIDENQPPAELPPATTEPTASSSATPSSIPNPGDNANRKSQPVEQSANTTAAATTATQTKDQPTAATTPAVARLLAGVRIYPEQDVVLHTTKGDIRIALRPDEAPNTAWNFLELARGGFYRDIPFHRIVPLTPAGQPFVIQAGDPTADATTGGDGGAGYWLPMEKSDLPHDFGVISMARSDDPDSASSQFFICLSREGTARLDGQYCSFGYAVSGASVILAIATTELANVAEGRAVVAPRIIDAQLVAAPPRVGGVGRPDERVQPNVAAPPPEKPRFVPR
jgi:cyclophilin family peptidyl-prolyl cis-trans isomerase